MPNDAAHDNDDDLLALRMSEGDKNALRRVLDLHAAKVKSILKRRYRETVQDLEFTAAINAAALAMWKAAARFDSRKGSLGGWFLTIAERKVLDIIDKGQIDREHFVQPAEHFDPPDPLAEEATDQENTLPTDRKHLQRLKQVRWFAENKLVGLQRAIVLADLASPSGQADSHRLAEHYGRAVNTIEVSRNKARKNLKTWITEWDSQQQRLQGKT